MADLTRLSDVIVPEIFTPYVQQITEEKTRIVRSGVLQLDSSLSSLLAGGGLTFNQPSWRDLDSEVEENISSDKGDDAVVHGTSAAQEIQVRLNRNNHWGAADLTGTLAGSDPMASIADRVATYWSRRLQRAFIATARGVFAGNKASDSGDMIHDVSGSAFDPAKTSITASAVIDTTLTMGDSMDDLGVMIVHPVVMAQLKKNNLIEYIPDARGEIAFPRYLGREVIVDQAMPMPSTGVFETWLFDRGAFGFGRGTPRVATTVTRNELANQGGGEEVLHNRVEWLIHPRGFAFVGTTPPGGPDNATLSAASSWSRIWQDRRMVKMAKLVTREM